jgi:peptide/nickel transport system substrate-binding protein
MFGKATVWGLLTTLLLPAANVAGAEQAPLRIAMTLADIPLTDGAPDQGTEGIRFLGYTVYDPLIPWDLSSADPAGAPSPWPRHLVETGSARPHPLDLRIAPGVRFHDGSIRGTSRRQRSAVRRRIRNPERRKNQSHLAGASP